MNLRYYQRDCHDAILRAWGVPGFRDENHEVVRSTLAQIPTAAGKTIVAAKVVETLTTNHGGRCLFIADTDELCAQPLDKFRRATGIYAALEKADHRASLRSDVVIGSAQTLIRPNRRDRFPRDHFTHIFVDEAHRGSDRNKEITDYFEAAKVCGLTATAFRKNLSDLSEYYEDVAYELGLFDLVGAGFIVPIKVLTLPLKVDLTKVREAKFMGEKDFKSEDLDESIAPWFEAIAQAIKEHAPNRQIISYLPLIKTSETFVTICHRAGINARHVDGQDPLRSEKIEGFARKEFQLLGNSFLLTTGWDCTTVDCLLNLRPTESTGLFRQMAGRIIRTEDGLLNDLTEEDQAEERKARIAASSKPDALIIDLLWQTEKMGLVGPASLIAGNEADAHEIQTRLRLTGETRELSQVSDEVRRDREEELRQLLAERAERAEMLMDAREVGLLFNDRQLIDFEPVVKWEKQKLSDKQSRIIEQMGINPDTIKSRGMASKILDAIFSRQKKGLAPLEAFKPLREAGIEHPEKMTLDDAIRTLGENFPCTFGKKYRGCALGSIPLGFWNWLSGKYEAGEMYGMEQQHPAVFRYMRKRLRLQPTQTPVESLHD
jgi:superfamily II DNA or RNA helicase